MSSSRSFQRGQFRHAGSSRPALAFLLCLLLVGVVPFNAALAVPPQQDVIDPAANLNAKADKLLRRVYRAASEMTSAGRTSNGARLRAARAELNGLSEIVALGESADGNPTVSLTVTLGGRDAAELKAAGFAVGATVGDVATVESEVRRLPQLASLSSVRGMKADTFRYPANDRARQSVGIDNAAGQRVVAQKGSGVVVGVIDTGIDFRHLDFTVPGSAGKQTRIKALLDMTAYNGSTAGWNYTLPGGSAPIGRLSTEADINAALQSAKPADQNLDTVKERDRSGHGTHVAGTAAGNGLAAAAAPGTYAGMAPEANLVIVKASRQNDGSDNFSTTDTINALQFIQQKASELNQPFVINMSLGGQLGPHDGTGDDERAIDNIVNGGGGRAVCVAAGNDGDDSIHARATVPAGGNISLDLNVTSSPQYIDLYYAKSDRLNVTVTRPDGTTLGPVTYNANGFGVPPVEDQFVRVFNASDNKGDSDPSNDQPDIFIIFKDNVPTGVWHFTIQDADGAPNSSLDAWATGDNVSFQSFVDNNSHLVGSPGTSRGAVTVGAFVTRSASQTIGNYAPFTSPGPTADGRQKPDISTPGYYLYSPRSSDVSDGNIFVYGTGSNATVDAVNYGGLLGTSMATPVATGSIALLYQVNRNLTIAQVKNLISSTANHDTFDPAGWQPRFGFGKLNIAAAINALAPAPPTNPIDGSDFFVKQQYADFFGRQPDAAGLNFWTNNIESCGTNASCREAKRIDTSAAFFLSIEFQQTGYLVYRLHKVAFGNLAGKPVPVTRAQFLPDTRQIGQGVVVGAPGADAQLEANKVAFINGFITRPQFTAIYPQGIAAATYVDTLFANAAVTPQGAERQNAITAYGAGDNAGRAAALRSVAESQTLQQSEFNRAFVAMQYFGYLQRDPDAAPDFNFNGYNFWLGKLNQFNGDFRGAEMVKAFITSGEYRGRFGTP